MTISRNRISRLIKQMEGRGIGHMDKKSFMVMDCREDGKVICDSVVYESYEDFEIKNNVIESDMVVRITWQK